MKVIAYVTSKATGKCRELKDIPQEEWQEIGEKLTTTFMAAAGATPMKGQNRANT